MAAPASSKPAAGAAAPRGRRTRSVGPVGRAGTGREGWLYGPAPDLLLGAGAGYLLSVPLLALLGSWVGLDSWPTAVAALLALFVSGPHYGATILRVYEQRADRRKYAVFAVWATVVLAALFGVGLHSALVGSLLVTLYATWSPWHFSGQNYGLALTFLRRRGVALDARAKRLLHASFALSFALAFLVIHDEASQLVFAAAPAYDGSYYRFLSLGLPEGFLRIAAPLTAFAYGLSLAGAAALLLRGGARPRDLAPAACLVLTQALWFAIPAALPLLGATPLEGLAFAILWISAAHAAQYLWVTSYYARREDPSLGLGVYLGRALLAGSAVTLAPALVFAPSLLGNVPWDVGLAVLVFSVVNLHHFVLDGAVWKLRDGRVARVLLRDAAPPAERRAAAERPRLRPLAAVLGLLCLAVAGIDLWEREVGVNRSGGDLERAHRAAERLAWIGRDPPGLHAQIAEILARQGRLDEALVEYQHSLDLFPSAEAWLGLARLHAELGDGGAAREAFEAARALAPDAFPGDAPPWLEAALR